MKLIFFIAEHISPYRPRDVVGETLCGDDLAIVLFEVDGAAAEVNCVEMGVCEGYSRGVWVGGVPERQPSADCIEGIVDFCD